MYISMSFIRWTVNDVVWSPDYHIVYISFRLNHSILFIFQDSVSFHRKKNPERFFFIVLEERHYSNSTRWSHSSPWQNTLLVLFFFFIYPSSYRLNHISFQGKWDHRLAQWYVCRCRWRPFLRRRLANRWSSFFLEETCSSRVRWFHCKNTIGRIGCRPRHGFISLFSW